MRSRSPQPSGRVLGDPDAFPPARRGRPPAGVRGILRGTHGPPRRGSLRGDSRCLTSLGPGEGRSPRRAGQPRFVGRTGASCCRIRPRSARSVSHRRFGSRWKPSRPRLPIRLTPGATVISPSPRIRTVWDCEPRRTSLLPGGSLYSEWRSPSAGGWKSIRRSLEAAGFEEVACYWPRPDPAGDPGEGLASARRARGPGYITGRTGFRPPTRCACSAARHGAFIGSSLPVDPFARSRGAR